jgi:hypothetical protein
MSRDNRKSLILAGITKENTRGVEIGPWSNPLAPRKEGWNTTIIDCFETEMLRTKAKQQSNSSGPGFVESIEDVDIQWKGGSLKSILEKQDIRELDYFVSSHNIEHAVDVIDYLQAAEYAIGKKGVVAMAIPDLRFTFDLFRNPSTIVDALRVYRQSSKYHDPESVLDQSLNAASNNGMACWTTSTAIQDLGFVGGPTSAFEAYQKHLSDSNPEYLDCHRWCFLPASFRLLIHDLRLMGLLNLRITRLHSAENGILGSEFVVQLKHAKRSRSIHANINEKKVKKLRLSLQIEIMQQLAERTKFPSYEYTRRR